MYCLWNQMPYICSLAIQKYVIRTTLQMNYVVEKVKETDTYNTKHVFLCVLALTFIHYLYCLNTEYQV